MPFYLRLQGKRRGRVQIGAVKETKCSRDLRQEIKKVAASTLKERAYQRKLFASSKKKKGLGEDESETASPRRSAKKSEKETPSKKKRPGSGREAETPAATPTGRRGKAPGLFIETYW